MTENVKVDLYSDIKTAIESISDVKHVLHYNEQELNNDSIVQKNYPQCWIHFSGISWQPNMLNARNSNQTQAQKGDIEITIYISQSSLKNDNDTFLPDMSLVNSVYRALTQIDNENYTPLQRVSEADNSHNNVRIWQITFLTMVTECGVSARKVDAAPVELKLNVGPF